MTKIELIEKFERELRLLHYAPSTVQTYTSCLAVFLRNYKKYNGYKNIEDVKSFLQLRYTCICQNHPLSVV
jgi:hypothetical protein